MIPFVNLIGQRNAYKSELEQAEQAVFDSGCYIGGPAVSQLEASLAEFCGVQNAIACGSGTEALAIALMAMGIGPGDEVIVPDFTFIAPAECVAALGATPIFADIDPETLQISPRGVESLVTPATKGIIAVDLFGQCAPFSELRKIARNRGLWIIEDAAQAFGASVEKIDDAQVPQGDLNQLEPSDTSGAHDLFEQRRVFEQRDHFEQHLKQRYACTFGDIAITSFYPSKPLGCYGDGGALFTDDSGLAAKIRQIANHGSSARYLHEIVGVNSRLDAIQAAVLNVKLKHFEEELGKRRENAAKYDAFFAGIGGIKPQRIADGNTSTYAQYTVLADDRDAFTEKLKRAEIPYCIHYPMALHRQPCFAKEANADDGISAASGSTAPNSSASRANKDCELNSADKDCELNSANKDCELNSADIASKKAVSLPVCAFTDVDAIIEKLRNAL